jgi:hypothetical protein
MSGFSVEAQAEYLVLLLDEADRALPSAQGS